MKRTLFGALAFAGSVLMLVSSANSQPPGGKGGKGGEKGGMQRFELGTLLPQFVKAELKLTADQEKDIAALEKDVKEKLDKILTAEQKKSLENIRPRGGPGGPGGPGGGGRPGEGGKPGGEKKPPMPPPFND